MAAPKKYEPYGDKVRWMPAKNVSGEDCPPFAVVRIIRWNQSGRYWEIGKPDMDSQVFRLAHNGRVTIRSNKIGKVTRDYPWWGVEEPYDGTTGGASGGSLAEGDECGTEADDWYLHPEQTGFHVLCAKDDTLQALQIDLNPDLQGLSGLPDVDDYAGYGDQYYGDGCEVTDEITIRTSQSVNGECVVTDNTIYLPFPAVVCSRTVE